MAFHCHVTGAFSVRYDGKMQASIESFLIKKNFAFNFSSSKVFSQKVAVESKLVGVAEMLAMKMSLKNFFNSFAILKITM